jgi:WD40 repeat protein
LKSDTEIGYVGDSYRSDYPLSILVTSVDKSLKIVDYQTGEVCSMVTFLKSRSLLMQCETMQVEHIITPHKAAILCFAIHPRQRRYLLTGSMDGS